MSKNPDPSIIKGKCFPYATKLFSALKSLRVPKKWMEKIHPYCQSNVKGLFIEHPNCSKKSLEAGIMDFIALKKAEKQK